MSIIGENGFRSISLDKKNTREYPQGVFASHVLGFITLMLMFQTV